jgi:hypothetical protein
MLQDVQALRRVGALACRTSNVSSSRAAAAAVRGRPKQSSLTAVPAAPAPSSASVLPRAGVQLASPSFSGFIAGCTGITFVSASTHRDHHGLALSTTTAPGVPAPVRSYSFLKFSYLTSPYRAVTRTPQEAFFPTHESVPRSNHLLCQACCCHSAVRAFS